MSKTLLLRQLRPRQDLLREAVHASQESFVPALARSGMKYAFRNQTILSVGRS